MWEVHSKLERAEGKHLSLFDVVECDSLLGDRVLLLPVVNVLRD